MRRLALGATLAFFGLAALVALLADDPLRALVHALAIVVVLQGVDAARLRDRVRRLEASVEEITERSPRPRS